MPAAQDQLTDDERADLTSFAATQTDEGRDLVSLLVAEKSAGGRASLARVREFSERYLPSRGWSRVLVIADPVGTAAIRLSEQGYDVAIAQRDPVLQAFVVHRLERRGLTATVLDVAALQRRPRSFDAIVVGAGIPLPRTVRRVLRRGGVVVGVGPGSAG